MNPCRLCGHEPVEEVEQGEVDGPSWSCDNPECPLHQVYFYDDEWQKLNASDSVAER